MKKTISLLLLLLLISTPSILGQKHLPKEKHHIRVGVGIDFMMALLMNEYMDTNNSPTSNDEPGWGEEYLNSKNEMERSIPFPMYKLEYTYRVSSNWEIGGNINYGYTNRESRWNIPQTNKIHEKINLIGVTGTARWIWFRSSIVELGSSVGLGVGYLSSRAHLMDGKQNRDIAIPLFQLNFFNLNIGQRSSVYMDIYGSSISIGYGYRF